MYVHLHSTHRETEGATCLQKKGSSFRRLRGNTKQDEPKGLRAKRVHDWSRRSRKVRRRTTTERGDYSGSTRSSRLQRKKERNADLFHDLLMCVSSLCTDEVRVNLPSEGSFLCLSVSNRRLLPHPPPACLGTYLCSISCACCSLRAMSLPTSS